ncbi:MAG: glycosyltransferase [Ectobacillus sp.]
MTQESGIICVMNPIGGGTAYYQQTYIEQNKHAYRIYKMTYASGVFRIESWDRQQYTCNMQSLQALLKSLNIDLIYINHFLQFPVWELMEAIQSSGIKYMYVIHDFFCICPRIHLITGKGSYCHNETDAAVCQSCLRGLGGVGVQVWRERFAAFLSGAEQVIAPSNSAKEIVQKHFPHILITVKEHAVSQNIHHTYNPAFARGQSLHAAFIGNIHKHKGADIVYELKRAIKKEKLPVRLTVLGTTGRHRSFTSRRGNFIVTGPYDSMKISGLLAQHKIALVIIPSICPETFSYTTSEALHSGYPVIAFDRGAPAERIKKYDGGWVLQDASSGSVLQLLKRLLQDRGEILQKAKHLAAVFQNKDI